MNLLIADDSDFLRQSLKRLLKTLDYEIKFSEARNIKDTMDILSHSSFDLVILDLKMPDGNGLQALKKIKQMDPLQRVMILTNYPSVLNRKKCGAAGADYFFDKSEDLENVHITLSALWSQNGDGTKHVDKK